MAKRGFFAELNYQAQQAEKRRQQQERAAARDAAAAARKLEQSRRAAERAQAAAQRADAAAQKAAEKEAKLAHIAAREDEVAAMNAELTSTYNDIDTLLEFTLSIDDYVDLQALKATAEHPEFEPGDLETPTIPPVLSPDPGPPVYEEPAEPKGLAGAFGGKKKHAVAVEAAQAEHAARLYEYEQLKVERAAWFEQATATYRRLEDERLAKLAAAQESYGRECAEREAEVAAQNAELDKFINDLAFDVPTAIEEYVAIVLSNSVYPDVFPVSYEHSFDLGSRELALSVTIPEPGTLPTVKEYRYVKTKDEITSTALTAKAQKDRYASALHQTAVRTLHEVFEADRAGKIHSIALTVGVNRISPSTGLLETVPLAVVAADRATFTTFDLSQIVPLATLEHMGASVSKNPCDLTPADTARGVRQRGK